MVDILIGFLIYLVALILQPFYFIVYFGRVFKHFLYFRFLIQFIPFFIKFDFLIGPLCTIIMNPINNLRNILICVFSLVAKWNHKSSKRMSNSSPNTVWSLQDGFNLCHWITTFSGFVTVSFHWFAAPTLLLSSLTQICKGTAQPFHLTR